METREEKIKRTLGNFSRIPRWSVTMTKSEIDFLFEKHSDFIFCNGQLRLIKAECIGGNNYKVYTIKF